jgi:hypothetical protein
MEPIGATQAALRETHLIKYHLSTPELLTPTHVRRYSALRGYGSVRAITPSASPAGAARRVG